MIIKRLGTMLFITAFITGTLYIFWFFGGGNENTN